LRLVPFLALPAFVRGQSRLVVVAPGMARGRLRAERKAALRILSADQPEGAVDSLQVSLQNFHASRVRNHLKMLGGLRELCDATLHTCSFAIVQIAGLLHQCLSELWDHAGLFVDAIGPFCLDVLGYSIAGGEEGGPRLDEVLGGWTRNDALTLAGAGMAAIRLRTAAGQQ
jgi:hypothetical protein